MLRVQIAIESHSDVANENSAERCDANVAGRENDEAFLKVHPNGYDGRVSRLMPTADRAQGAIPVRVGLKVSKEEEGVYLKPDMGGIVSFKKQGK